MIVKRFRANKVHGYLDFDVKFNDDLTFLTGINGAGKTTVVHSVVGLITPSLGMLSRIEYNDIEVSIKDGKNLIKITSKRSDGNISIATSLTKEELIFSLFISDEEEDVRNLTHEREYYESIESTNSQHPVLKLIGSLPTPMFLNLDRRASTFATNKARMLIARRRRRARNVFGASLMQSLAEAADLAEDAYGQIVFRQGRLGQELRRKVVMNAFIVPPSTPGVGWPISAPTADDRQAIEYLENAIPQLTEILELPEREVNDKFFPYVENLRRVVARIPRDTAPDQIIKSGEKKGLNALIEWAKNKPIFDRVQVLLSDLRWYNEQNETFSQPITQYLSLINRFIRDSGKQIIFDDSGNLSVNIEGMGINTIQSLSSGEAQIVVIVTHLTFNPAAQRANVFIIDEPELSLHVEWQDIFVETLRAANENVQLILATHSPSIISESIKNCIALPSISRISKK